MYDPTIGRWISEDPVEFEAGDSNLFRYVKNNPVADTDPSGLQERQRQDNFERYQRYLERNDRVHPSELLSFEEWLAREQGRPAPAPPNNLGQNPLGPTPEQAERDRNAQAFAQQQAIPETPRVFQRTPGEQRLLDEQLRRLNYDLMYYQFWFYDVPGALSGLVIPGVGGSKQSASAGSRPAMRNQRPPSRPTNAPSGTLAINEHPSTRDIVHKIKDNLREEGVGPRSYVGIAPNGDVIVTNPDGTAANLGNWGQYAN